MTEENCHRYLAAFNARDFAVLEQFLAAGIVVLDQGLERLEQGSRGKVSREQLAA